MCILHALAFAAPAAVTTAPLVIGAVRAAVAARLPAEPPEDGHPGLARIDATGARPS